ncbi:MAG: histidine phosphatase family protein [Geminicoccaceae bacterium]
MSDQARKSLVLFRHAKSSWSSPSLADVDRPLTARGQKAAPRMAAHLGEEGHQTDWIWCSSARRTRETWELMAPLWAAEPVIAFDPGLYLAQPADISSRIKETPERIASVMVIGHNPGLQELAVELSALKPGEVADEIAAHFPTAAAAIFELNMDHWAELAPHRVLGVTFRKPRMLPD